MTGSTLILAHAGEGATWQALLVVLSVGLVVEAVLAVLGRVRLDQADDLVLPLAGVAIVSSLAPLASEFLSDWVGWAFPAGVVALLAILAAALTPFDLSPRSPFTYGVAAIAIIAAVALHQPITLAWHPPPDFLPIADDIEVAITAPADSGDVPAGELTVTLTITGGSVQSELLAPDQVPTDPEEAGQLAVAIDGQVLTPEFVEDCTVDAPCTEVTFPVEVEPGERVIAVEYRRGDGVPMTPLVTDRVEFTAS
ncbi:MAG: hypothetical protein WD010_04890 [Nitriliruptor sp.]